MKIKYCFKCENVFYNLIGFCVVFCTLKLSVKCDTFFVGYQEKNKCRSPPSINLNFKNFKLIGG